MRPLEPLAPDQRAVVALVLQQGRSYDEIAALLGIPVDAVRARAQAGLAALAPGDGLPAEVTGPLADYLLGQQPARDADATRGLIAESAPARAWATDVAAALDGVAPGALPEIPAGEDATPRIPVAAVDAGQAAAELAAAEPTAPRPRPERAPAGPQAAGAPPAASRLGGVLLIGAVLAVVAVVLFLVLTGGDDEPADDQAATPAATASPTATPTAAPAQVADEIPLRATGGGKATGTMTVYVQGDQLGFTLEAEDVPPSTDATSYAVWFTGPGTRAKRLGFTSPVGTDGVLGIQGPGENDVAGFPKLYATYENVVVSEESTEDARRPAKVILTGKLPQGR